MQVTRFFHAATPFPSSRQFHQNRNFPEKHTESGRTATEEDVRDLIERHPSTVDGTAAGLGISSGLSARLIASLKEKGVLREEERGDGTYYFLAEQRHD